jgi:hypothetical protein
MQKKIVDVQVIRQAVRGEINPRAQQPDCHEAGKRIGVLPRSPCKRKQSYPENKVGN